MLSLVFAVRRSLAAGFHARRHLALENLALRHQLLVLNRTVKVPHPPQFRPSFLGSPLRDLVAVDERVGDRPAADGSSLASGWIPVVLTLEIAPSLGSHAEGP
jgi:hypothetical protein